MTGTPVAFLLPGQGAQYAGMAVDLHAAEPAFAKAVDALFEEAGEQGARLRAAWLGADSATALDEGVIAQPLLFALCYALGRCLREEYGIRPVAYLGHSVGELAGAALANVFGDGAAAVMAARARSVRVIPAGGMLAVAATPNALEPYLDPPDRPDGVVVAAHNSSMNTVVAGPEPRLSEVGAALRAADVAWRAVPARQAFHSPSARYAADLLARDLAKLDLRPPDATIWSTATGCPVRDEEAVEPAFWAGQLARAVLFREALDGLLAGEPVTLVEVGPAQTLSAFARRHRAVRRGGCEVVPLLPAGRENTVTVWRDGLARLGR
jgi:acyl transferase domain-containing protein